jgi:outer membrane protein assembly factor BamE (lipoprotein component of BamABCDE complex)
MKTNVPVRVSGFLMAPLMIACLAASSGCMNTSSGTPIDTATVSKIEKGKTTRAQVEAMLGKPDMTMMLGDGRRLMSYAYTSTKIGVNPATAMLGPLASGSGSTRSQTLQIFLSKDGVVEDYELNDNTRDIRGNGLNVQSTNR